MESSTHAEPTQTATERLTPLPQLLVNQKPLLPRRQLSAQHSTVPPNPGFQYLQAVGPLAVSPALPNEEAEKPRDDNWITSQTRIFDREFCVGFYHDPTGASLWG